MRIFEINALANILHAELKIEKDKKFRSLDFFKEEIPETIKKLKKDKVWKQYIDAVHILKKAAKVLSNTYNGPFTAPAGIDINSTAATIATTKYTRYRNSLQTASWQQIKDAIVVAGLCNDGNNVANVVRAKLGLQIKTT